MTIYVIGKPGSTIVKIGLSGQNGQWEPPEARVRELEHSNGQPLERLGWMPGGQPLERKLHGEFKEWRLNHGEWFELPPNVLKRFVTRLLPWDQKGPLPQPHPVETDPVTWRDELIVVEPVLPGCDYPKRRINPALRRTLDGSPVPTTVETGECDYYTPPLYVESARTVLGSIDLDPASSDLANRMVKATRYYTIEEDGLRQEWAGNIFLNPPWGGAARNFVARALQEYRGGRINQAVIVLSAEYTDRQWMKALGILDRFPFCLTDHRVNYYNMGGSPTAGTLFIYLGTNVQGFVDAFTDWGPVCLRLRTTSESA
jgi:hypothetical protein